VFEFRALKKIFGPKWGEVSEARKILIDKFVICKFHLDIIGLSKLRRVTSVRHVERAWKERNAYGVQ
jgi:hypothetical protein